MKSQIKLIYFSFRACILQDQSLLLWLLCKDNLLQFALMLFCVPRIYMSPLRAGWTAEGN